MGHGSWVIGEERWWKKLKSMQAAPRGGYICNQWDNSRYRIKVWISCASGNVYGQRVQTYPHQELCQCLDFEHWCSQFSSIPTRLGPDLGASAKSSLCKSFEEARLENIDRCVHFLAVLDALHVDAPRRWGERVYVVEQGRYYARNNMFGFIFKPSNNSKWRKCLVSFCKLMKNECDQHFINSQPSPTDF